MCHVFCWRPTVLPRTFLPLAFFAQSTPEGGEHFHGGSLFKVGREKWLIQSGKWDTCWEELRGRIPTAWRMLMKGVITMVVKSFSTKLMSTTMNEISCFPCRKSWQLISIRLKTMVARKSILRRWQRQQSQRQWADMMSKLHSIKDIPAETHITSEHLPAKIGVKCQQIARLWKNSVGPIPNGRVGLGTWKREGYLNKIFLNHHNFHICLQYRIFDPPLLLSKTGPFWKSVSELLC